MHVSARTGSPVRSLGPATTVLLHLAPGGVAFLGYLAALPVAAALGLPSMAALAGSALLLVPAVQLGVMRVYRRRRPSEPAMALRNRLTPPRLIAWAALEVVLAGAAFAVTAPVTRAVQEGVFGWWPDAWVISSGTDGGHTQSQLLVTAGLLLIGTVLVAPVVEELYFRGFLLPRMPIGLGPWRVPVHVVMFALYHLWSPWLTPTRLLAVLPLAWIAQRTRDVRIGIVSHVVLNAVDLIVLLRYIWAR